MALSAYSMASVRCRAKSRRALRSSSLTLTRALVLAVVLSFRGSQSLTNWVYNLRFSKQEAYPNVPGAKVHNGFFQCYEAVSDQVHKQLQNAVTECPKCHTAVITGHSLGGVRLLTRARARAGTTQTPRISLALRGRRSPCWLRSTRRCRCT